MKPAEKFLGCESWQIASLTYGPILSSFSEKANDQDPFSISCSLSICGAAVIRKTLLGIPAISQAWR